MMELISHQVLGGVTYATVRHNGRDYSVWGRVVAVNYSRWSGLGVRRSSRTLDPKGPLGSKIIAFVMERGS
jgi:hypothetical protein